MGRELRADLHPGRPALVEGHAHGEHPLDQPRHRAKVRREPRAGEGRRGVGQREERDELVRQVVVHGGAGLEGARQSGSTASSATVSALTPRRPRAENPAAAVSPVAVSIASVPGPSAVWSSTRAMVGDSPAAASRSSARARWRSAIDRGRRDTAESPSIVGVPVRRSQRMACRGRPAPSNAHLSPAGGVPAPAVERDRGAHPDAAHRGHEDRGQVRQQYQPNQ